MNDPQETEREQLIRLTADLCLLTAEREGAITQAAAYKRERDQLQIALDTALQALKFGVPSLRPNPEANREGVE